MATKLYPNGQWLDDDDDDGPYIDQYGDEWDCTDGYDFWNYGDDGDDDDLGRYDGILQ